MKHLFLLVLVLSIFCFSAQSAISNSSSVLFIPTEEEYYPFLVNGWDPSRANVLVFKDPYCPYCIKAIPKLSELQGYNVFIFWAPILGPSSLRRVDDIFHCESPASMQVLNAVLKRENPFCKLPLNNQLLALNQSVVDNYQINSVPRFYLQGQQVSFGQLKQMQTKHPPINGVSVDWSRFALMHRYPRYKAHSIGIVVPTAYHASLDKLIATYKPEFVFLDPALLDKNPEFLACTESDTDCLAVNTLTYKKRLAEFQLMFGDAISQDKLLLIDNNGMLKEIDTL